MPPTKLWFVDRIKFPEGDVGHSKKVYGVTPTFFLANGKPITGASVISREDHQDPDKTLNVRDCALTVAHELGHVLGLEHQCDKLKPGLMCTDGQHGVPPQFSLDEKQLKTIRNSAFLKKG